ncbi:MAG: hypothetical protein AB8H12_19965 [Lewinella sp.]
MKFTSLLFALLFLVAQTGNAQTTRTARMDVPKASKGLSDAEILAKADNIRYRALHQDYSNIVTALADSELEVKDRLAAFSSLTEAYFGNLPKTVKLPANLLKADGSSFSDKEMGDFMARLTKKPVPDAAAKTMDAAAVACVTEYYQNIWPGSPMSQVYPDWVIVMYTGSSATPACNGSHLYLALPASILQALGN